MARMEIVWGFGLSLGRPCAGMLVILIGEVIVMAPSFQQVRWGEVAALVWMAKMAWPGVE